ncbi:ADP-ribosyltransferase [Nocardia beijingensis]
MTVIDVSVPTYYDTAQKLADAASQFWAAVDGEWPAMAQATNMAGSYSDGKKWGQSYDTRATEILDLVSRLATAAHGYAVILQQIGYNHECAEWVATVDNNAIPVKPAEPIPPVIVCRIPLPSAGGPGNGLVDEGIGLAEMIGIIVPDGNATTMSNAADTWERTARAAAVAGFPAALDAAATALQTITAPESAYVDEDLRALKTAADTVITAMTDLAQSCRDHRHALDELRNDLKIQLESIRDALLTELAINAAVSIASSWITLGASAAIGVAGAAAICARYARPIRVMIEQWQNERRIAQGVKYEQDIQRAVQEVKRLEELRPGGPLKPKLDPPRPTLSADDVAVLRQGPSDAQANSLTAALREGRVTPEQQRQIDAFNQALGKLPAHEGPVVRHTNLTDEQLAKYVEGEPHTEVGFTSTSINPKGANEFLVNNSNVEFEIISKTGRDYRQYGTPDEILFPSGTNFFVHSKKFDDATGRWIIKMAER